jgi:DNA-binding PadR family transcriptional regulator
MVRKREFIGGFELLVLLALLRLGDEAYGVPIAEAIEESSGRDVAMGSVYVTLERLERKGLVSSRLGEPTPERGGRAKTYFRITAKGLREARQAQRTLVRLWKGVPRLEGGLA